MPDYTDKETLLGLAEIDPELDAVSPPSVLLHTHLSNQVPQRKPIAASRLHGHHILQEDDREAQRDNSTDARQSTTVGQTV